MNLFGIGYDVHQFADGRQLILGGVEIEHAQGLLGHSDADVLLHAISDALLGAVGEHDIGHHFPNTDESIRGISSIEILKRVRAILARRHAIVVNIDATVIAEAPKINPHVDAMRDNIAHTLLMSRQRVNIKATTNEKMGFLGRGEGIAALAVAGVQLHELPSHPSHEALLV